MALSYSLHLSAKKHALSTTSKVSQVSRHNLRKYETQDKDIKILEGGSFSVYENVKEIYEREFEKCLKEYNDKQSKPERQIKDYLKHVSDSRSDVAAEIIIQIGDKDFWEDKSPKERHEMEIVFKEQLEELKKQMPNFKIASAVVHYGEKSPHMHIVGVPIAEGYKKGMERQVAKTKIFTQETLSNLQDTMRESMKESMLSLPFLFHEETLKAKRKGRNRDFDHEELEEFKETVRELEKEYNELDERYKEKDKALSEQLRIKFDVQKNQYEKNNKVIEKQKETISKNNSLINKQEENLDLLKQLTNLVPEIDFRKRLRSTMEKILNSRFLDEMLQLFNKYSSRRLTKDFLIQMKDEENKIPLANLKEALKTFVDTVKEVCPIVLKHERKSIFETNLDEKIGFTTKTYDATQDIENLYVAAKWCEDILNGPNTLEEIKDAYLHQEDEISPEIVKNTTIKR